MICGQTVQQVNFPLSLIVKVEGAAGFKLFLAELSHLSVCFSVEWAGMCGLGNGEHCITPVVTGSIGFR